MRVAQLRKLFYACAVLFIFSIATRAGTTPNEAAKLLPDHVGDYRAQKAALPLPLRMIEHGSLKPADFDIVAAANTVYLSPAGEKFAVDLVQTVSDSGAYALLSRHHAQGYVERAEGVGTYNIILPKHAIAFYKGARYVLVSSLNNQTGDDTELVNFARAVAQTLDAGGGEMPPLVAQLPGGEAAERRALYAVSLPALQESVRNQPALDALSFAGGTEAVTAKYEQGQLVIVEFQTPQLATDNDTRIAQRIAELRAQHQPLPPAYRREGNYAVFVFDAPSEQAANDLIGQVKYEKVVQWLGEDPHRFERANRFWLNMSSSLIVNTVKATGLAILLCLSVGGLFGGVIFMRRRAQAALSEKYSDAGGMMRLNLDELAAEQTPAARLLPPRQE